MLIKHTKGWELPERQATPEGHYLRRRELVAAMGLGVATIALPGLAAAQDADPSAGRYPAKSNDKFGAPSPITAERLATTYNNYYEFDTDKSIWRAAQKLPVRPPAGDAKYIVMQTLSNPKVMTGQKDILYPWPYTEGLAIDEATHDLAFIATGLYGKPIHKQNGAPLRLVAPWKYGFKNVKAIVSIEFTEKRPVSFWEKLADNEYGFWANVNPKVPHPRWSQATEKPLGSDERVPTQLYNGYAEFVAGLYESRKSEKLFM